MHEPAPADPHAHVPQVMEEHEVARAKIPPLDLLVPAVLVPGNSGDPHTGLPVCPRGQTRTVEPSSPGPTPPVGGSALRLGGPDCGDRLHLSFLPHSVTGMGQRRE